MNSELAAALLALPGAEASSITRKLIAVGERPAEVSSAGYPYLAQESWELLRDEVPHLFQMGLLVLDAADLLQRAAVDLVEVKKVKGFDGFVQAMQVVRQVVATAAVTAPPDLWLLRHVLSGFGRLGLSQRLLEGQAIYPRRCVVEGQALNPRELEIELHFLEARGIVESYDESYRVSGHPRVRSLLLELGAAPLAYPANLTRAWRDLFQDAELAAAAAEALAVLGREVPRRAGFAQNHWLPTVEEVELGYRLLPVVLALRAAGRTGGLESGVRIRPEDWSARHSDLAAGALRILDAAGWVVPARPGYRVTALGERGFRKGPGPFGIIEAYHPYLAEWRRILLHGAAGVAVHRGENIAASQDANHASFAQANDDLDRFCRDTGFRYRVFIEHAVGRGEATRIRFERSGEAELRYFGADLEDAAIDAALEEQRHGRLPANMSFVRRADIGRPEILLQALDEAGVAPRGAVMMVGNGFHEVREQTDERMIEVFSGYERAGIVLSFTEENALSVADLRATAWNTYHAGFKYVHEKSGQGLRPAAPLPPRHAASSLRAAWSECAQQAGYVRAGAYCRRSRTIYPYATRDGYNPSISTNHFFVPREIAAELGLLDQK